MAVSFSFQENNGSYLYPMRELFRGVVSELSLNQSEMRLYRAEMRFLMALPRRDLYFREASLGAMKLVLHTVGFDNQVKIEQAVDLVFRRLNGQLGAPSRTFGGGLAGSSAPFAARNLPSCTANLSVPKENAFKRSWVKGSVLEKGKRSSSLPTEKSSLGQSLDHSTADSSSAGCDRVCADELFSSYRRRLLVFHPECQIFVESPAPESP